MIELRQVSKVLGNFALKDISLSIEESAYYVILGPTGAGKTVLLDLIAGRYRADSGQIWISGVDVSVAPPEERRISYVYQDYMLFPHLNVLDNICFSLYKGRKVKSKSRTRAKDLADLLNIGHLLERRVHNLSGGEQQRVALARALIADPLLLLLDEPFSAVDPQSRGKLRLELKKIHEQLGTTTLHITHDFHEALLLADKISIIDNGRIVETGDPQDVFERPKTLFTANFVGMENIFAADIVAVGSKRFADPVSAREGLRLEVDSEILGPSYVCIRPENIRLDKQVEHDRQNVIRGRVKNISLSGNLLRLEVEAALDFVVLVAKNTNVGLGELIYLEISREAVHVLTEGGGHEYL